jgi:hypothetical protein
MIGLKARNKNATASVAFGRQVEGVNPKKD